MDKLAYTLGCHNALTKLGIQGTPEDPAFRREGQQFMRQLANRYRETAKRMGGNFRSFVDLGKLTPAQRHAIQPFLKQRTRPQVATVNVAGMDSPEQMANAAVKATLGRGWFTPKQEAQIQANMERMRKQGGARVLVTREQTPQEQSEPMNMAAEQQRTVEHLWDEHDKRQQLFTARNPD
jgi:hypothetical protein